MTDHRSLALDDLLSSSWDRKVVLGVVDELASLPGESYTSVEEVRRFLALKSYTELLHRLEAARENQSSHDAVRSVARAIRQFGLERPALFAAAFRKPASDATECRDACKRIYEFLIQVFAECGIDSGAADEAVHIRSG